MKNSTHNILQKSSPKNVKKGLPTKSKIKAGNVDLLSQLFQPTPSAKPA